MAVVHLIRHGESTWNRERRVQGSTAHVELTDVGRAQAVEAAAALGRIDELWTSDLMRARQTAGVIAVRHRLEPQIYRGLREQGLGVLEGLPFTEALTLAAGVDWTDPDARVTGGESLREVYLRLVDVFAPLATRRSARVAVVSHGDTIRVAIAVLAGRPVEAVTPTGVPNGSITTIDYAGSGARAPGPEK